MTDRLTVDILVEAYDLAPPDLDDLKDRIEDAAAAHKATVTVVGRRYPATAQAAVDRVTDLRDRWVQAGPPPLGASMARWWDARLIELNTALDEPKKGA